MDREDANVKSENTARRENKPENKPEIGTEAGGGSGEKREVLAAEAIRIGKNRLVTNMRFMDPAVFALKDVSTAEDGRDAGRAPMTDGTSFFYSPKDILMRAGDSITRLTHDYMHVLMHCIMKHYFISGEVNAALWNLAVDVAVEELVMSLGMDCFRCSMDGVRAGALSKLRQRYGKLTAPALYRKLLEGEMTGGELRDLGDVFRVDDHRLWYQMENSSPFELEEDTDEDREAREIKGRELVSQADWEKISEMVRTGMEMDDREQEAGEEKFSASLRDRYRKPVDFTTFLRKFASRRETVKVDDSSFDYIYYSYGMDLYGDMPLIEPLEYSDEKQIRDMVIAIDTSGSTEGSLVRSFVEKTFQILQNRTVIQRKFNIHLIQCDAKIQDVRILRDRNDVEECLNDLELRGMGGTDFRPVFRYVDQMVKEGRLRDLRGLLYFTDGKGIFPKKKPAYDTAFIFTDGKSEDIQVPPWAMKVEFSDELD